MLGPTVQKVATVDEVTGVAKIPRVKKKGKSMSKRIVLWLRIAWFAVLYLAWPLFKRWLSPAAVFFVYPGKPSDKYAFFTPWMEKRFRPVFPLGVMRLPGGRLGLMIAKPITTAEMDLDPSLALQTMEQIQAEVPKAKAVALAGRFPGYVHKAGGSFPQPFVPGINGTVFAMVSAADALAQKAGRPASELAIAVLGGAGTVGSKVVESTSHAFKSVVAFDIRYAEESTKGNVVFSSAPQRLRDADVAIVLTAEGDQVAELAPYFRAGAIVADDTHPCMYSETRRLLTARGVDLYKVAMEGDLRMFPRLPNFNATDVPGCLLEAVTVALRGWEVIEDQEEFNRAATAVGFKPRLYRHPDEN